ncbi:hypothetical protein E4U55_005214 [Claviceps digitariae]|nr:hypothetical protein E4U55_005214 [Claviceps digitariae]
MTAKAIHHHGRLPLAFSSPPSSKKASAYRCRRADQGRAKDALTHDRLDERMTSMTSMAPLASMAPRILHVPFTFKCAKSRPPNATGGRE